MHNRDVERQVERRWKALQWSRILRNPASDGWVQIYVLSLTAVWPWVGFLMSLSFNFLRAKNEDDIDYSARLSWGKNEIQEWGIWHFKPSQLLKLVLPLRWQDSSVGGRRWVVFARQPLGSGPTLLLLLSISICMSSISNHDPSNSWSAFDRSPTQKCFHWYGE